MSKRDDPPDNWQAFGEQLIEMARGTLNRDAGQPRDDNTFIAHHDARRILRLAEVLRLIEREPEPFAPLTGQRRAN